MTESVKELKKLTGPHHIESDDFDAAETSARMIAGLKKAFEAPPKAHQPNGKKKTPRPSA